MAVGRSVWEVVKGIFHCSGETAVSDRETGDMFVSAGSAACFGSVPCRKQGIERGLTGALDTGQTVYKR